MHNVNAYAYDVGTSGEAVGTLGEKRAIGQKCRLRYQFPVSIFGFMCMAALEHIDE